MFDLVKTVLAIIGFAAVLKRFDRKLRLKHTKKCDCLECDGKRARKQAKKAKKAQARPVRVAA